MSRSRKLITYYIVFAITFLVVFLNAGNALLFERISLQLPQLLLVLGLMLLVAVIVFWTMRQIGIRSAIRAHAMQKAQSKVKKRRSFFVREVLPILSVYIVSIGCIVIYAVVFANNGAPVNDLELSVTSNASRQSVITCWYTQYLNVVCMFLGRARVSILFGNAVLQVISLLCLYGFTKTVFSKTSALWASFLCMATPFMYRTLGEADAVRLYLCILLFIVFIGALIGKNQHIGARKAGFLLFAVWGAVCAAALYVSIAYVVAGVVCLLLLGFHADGARWKVSFRCILFYLVGYIGSALAVYFVPMLGMKFSVQLPTFLPFPEFYAGAGDVELILMMLSGAVIFLQAGCKREVLSVLSGLYMSGVLAVVFTAIPGNNSVLLCIVIANISIGCAFGMISDMAYLPRKRESSEAALEKAVTAEEKLIVSLTGSLSLGKTPKRESGLPMQPKENQMEYDLVVQDSDDYDI